MHSGACNNAQLWIAWLSPKENGTLTIPDTNVAFQDFVTLIFNFEVFRGCSSTPVMGLKTGLIAKASTPQETTALPQIPFHVALPIPAPPFEPILLTAELDGRIIGSSTVHIVRRTREQHRSAAALSSKSDGTMPALAEEETTWLHRNVPQNLSHAHSWYAANFSSYQVR